MNKKQKLLLLEDVHGLGKKGEIAQAKPGYFRNYLLPKKRAVLADKNTIRMQEKLQKEREEKAKLDRKESETLKDKLHSITLNITVKTDPEGRMYGSVTVADVLSLLKKEDIPLEKHCVKLPKAIKKVGKHTIPLLLKEDVEASIHLVVEPEDKLLMQTLSKEEDKPEDKSLSQEEKAPE